MSRCMILTAVVLLGLPPAHAADDGFMSYAAACKRDRVSNSEYRGCRARKLIEQVAVIKGKTGVQCNAERCLFKLVPRTPSDGRWMGEGYTLSFLGGLKAKAVLAEETEEEAIVISDPQKHISVFKACGTCSDLNYVRGPLKRAAVVFVSPKVEILAVPATSLKR